MTSFGGGLARRALFLYNTRMRFVKYHGLGNDFVIVNAAENPVTDWAVAARRVCDRRFGIGADGLVGVWPIDGENVKMRIFNADGSEAEMCGNVSRCVPLFWREKGLLTGTRLMLHTLAGPIITEIIDASKNLVCVDMGVPRLTRGEIPMRGNAEDRAIKVPVEAAGHTWVGTAVSMGNPHFVIFVPDLEKIDLPVAGPALEKHPDFPRKTNVEFVQRLDPGTLRMRVWERGVGITQACGTGACATLVAATLTGRTGTDARIILDGGELHVSWRGREHVFMTGPAQKVFEGEYVEKV